MVVGARNFENQPREKVGEEDEKPHRKREPQHERHRRQDVHRVEFELLRHPFVELGGLGVIAENFRRTHKYAHAHIELGYEIDHSAHERQTQKQTAFCGVLRPARLDGYLARFRADRGGDGRAPLHHHAFYDRLTAYRSAAYNLALFEFFLRAGGAFCLRQNFSLSDAHDARALKSLTDGNCALARV